MLVNFFQNLLGRKARARLDNRKLLQRRQRIGVNQQVNELLDPGMIGVKTNLSDQEQHIFPFNRVLFSYLYTRALFSTFCADFKIVFEVLLETRPTLIRLFDRRDLKVLRHSVSRGWPAECAIWKSPCADLSNPVIPYQWNSV